ncbi:MAG TPA: thioredoxin domain-containing protein [Bryobacteraceae bacterium]|nr:thioredoxin domain-containing protein [Bryobacteraceae bacterium]
MRDPKENGAIPTTPLCFIGAGWLLSTYLLIHAFILGAGRAPLRVGRPLRLICSGCEEILASASSFQMGAPLAAWGLIYFAVAGCLIAIGKDWAIRIALLLGAAGIGVSAVLTSSFISGRVSLCFVCLLVHVLNLCLFISIWFHVRLLPRLAPGSVLSPGVAFASLTAVIMIAAVSLQAAFWRPVNDVRKTLAEYDSSRRYPLNISPRDPARGSVSAPVQLVVFSSFQCPGCQQFVAVAEQLQRDFPRELTILYKHFPLGKGCNSELAFDLQPRACAAAYAAEAANRQGAFWPYHDRLFTSLLDGEAQLNDAARAAGIDGEKWDIDRQSSGVKAKVKEDIRLGIASGVDATPAVFLNGRRLKQFNLPLLEAAISREAARRNR